MTKLLCCCYSKSPAVTAAVHSSCAQLLDTADSAKYWWTAVSMLTVNTYNLGVMLYKAGQLADAEVQFRASCGSCGAGAGA